MSWSAVAAIVVGVSIVVAPLALLYSRRRWLTRQGGLFDCAHHVREGASGVSWVLGFARYRDDRLDWYRAFSLALSPTRSFPRAGTLWMGRRVVTPLEATILFDESWIVTVQDRYTSRQYHLAMDYDNAMGLMAWLESAPPGSHAQPGSANSP